jgi:hypothetical protein
MSDAHPLDLRLVSKPSIDPDVDTIGPAAFEFPIRYRLTHRVPNLRRLRV